MPSLSHAKAEVRPQSVRSAPAPLPCRNILVTGSAVRAARRCLRPRVTPDQTGREPTSIMGPAMYSCTPRRYQVRERKPQLARHGNAAMPFRQGHGRSMASCGYPMLQQQNPIIMTLMTIQVTRKPLSEAPSCRHEGVLVCELRDPVNRERDGIATVIAFKGWNFYRFLKHYKHLGQQSLPVATAHAGDGLPAFNARPFLAGYKVENLIHAACLQ